MHLLVKPDHISWVKSHMPAATFTPVSAPVYSVSEQLCLPRAIPRSTSLLWIPHFNIPVFSQFPIITTLHDVCHLARPEDFSNPLKRAVARQLIKQALNRSQNIICVSHFTRSEICRLLPTANHTRMSIIPNGVDTAWFSPLPDSSSPPIDQPYFIAVANLKPHKNLLRLIQAFLRIKADLPHHLVIAGDSTPKGSCDHAAMELARKHSDRIHLTGRVSEQADLIRLVAESQGLIFPSLYEGFGLPPLEAMACGCPVACSNIAPALEVCGEPFNEENQTGNVLYFSPDEVPAIAGSLTRLATLPATSKATLIRNGKQRAKSFDWHSATAQYATLFRENL